MKWLHDLAEYYSHNRDIPEIKIRMMAQAFQDEDPEVMEAAVFQYMQEQRWYPIIADLKPYVDTAKLDAQRHPDIYQAHTQKWLHTMKTWETCSACGERSPSPGEGCPFCRDMASAISYNVINGTAVDLEEIRAAAQAAKTQGGSKHEDNGKDRHAGIRNHDSATSLQYNRGHIRPQRR